MIHARSPLQKSQSARQMRPLAMSSKPVLPAPSDDSDFVSRFRRPFRSQSERALSQSQEITGTSKLSTATKSNLLQVRASADGLQSAVLGAGSRQGGHASEIAKSQDDAQPSERRPRYRSQAEEWAAIRKRYEAPPFAKMFVITGQFSGIREALLDRGWVEHHEYESTCFDLKWTVRTKQIDFERLQPHQIINHYAKNQHVTTKVGLSKSLRSLQWFEEVDRDTFFPRSYDLNDVSDVTSFVEDFMMVAAENALEDGLDNLDFNATVAEEDGSQRFLLALIACEDYIKHCSVGDLSEEEEETAPGEDEVRICRLPACDWGTILCEPCPAASATRLVGQGLDHAAASRRKQSDLEAIIQELRRPSRESGTDGAGNQGRTDGCKDEEGDDAQSAAAAEGAEGSTGEDDKVKLSALRERAVDALKEMRGMSAQSCLNGRGNVWIVKPAGKSRGRGIQVKQRLADILAFVTDGTRHNQERWVVQKYLEDPLLIGGRKFDIRQWVLVSDWNPLTVWFYDECYLRFALSDFQISNLEDNLVHLCNNCVQREAPDFEAKKAESMWDAEQFKSWLGARGDGGAWEERILPQLKRVAVWAVMCAQDNLVNRKGSCELFGYDFMLDSALNVWLLEVNSSPDMAATTEVTERLCRKCLYDVVRVVVDNNDSGPGRSKPPRRSGVDQTDDAQPASPAQAACPLPQPAVGASKASDGDTPCAAGDGAHSAELAQSPPRGGSGAGTPCDTGGWQRIHQGEVEASVPVSVSGKLRVQGTSMRIHRPGMREVLSKLGVDGTERKSVLRMSGSSKVWHSRTEMLREMNTMGPMPPPHLLRKSKSKPKIRAPAPDRPPDANGEEGSSLPAVVERMRAWEELKRSKLREKLRLEREKEEAELSAVRFKPKVVISHDEAAGFMQRMHRDAMKRVERNREHEEAVQEGIRKLERTSSQLERTGSVRRKKLKRGGSLKEKRKVTKRVASSSSSEEDDSSDED